VSKSNKSVTAQALYSHKGGG